MTMKAILAQWSIVLPIVSVRAVKFDFSQKPNQHFGDTDRKFAKLLFRLLFNGDRPCYSSNIPIIGILSTAKSWYQRPVWKLSPIHEVGKWEAWHPAYLCQLAFKQRREPGLCQGSVGTFKHSNDGRYLRSFNPEQQPKCYKFIRWIVIGRR